MIIPLTIIGLILDLADLGPAVLETAPDTYLTEEEAYVQSLATLEAETSTVSAELLLAMAWTESRYYPTAVSRIENGRRVTGIPRWKSPPKGARNFFCGVTQISAGNSWRKCKSVQDVFSAYKETIKELEQWMSPRVCGRNLRCALTGYSGGFAAIKSGTNNYASFVLNRAKLIKRKMQRRKDRNGKDESRKESLISKRT